MLRGRPGGAHGRDNVNSRKAGKPAKPYRPGKPGKAGRPAKPRQSPSRSRKPSGGSPRGHTTAASGRRTRPSGTGSDGKRTVGGEQVEGRHAVLELLMAGARGVHVVWVSSDIDDAAIVQDIRELAESRRVPVHEVSRSKLAAQARCEAPQGVLALAAQLPEQSLDDLLHGRRMPSSASRGAGSRSNEAPFLVALDGVTDPGNLGAVLRSAECAGATGAVLPRHRAVNVTPAAAKAAAGAIEHLPIALVGGLPSALAELQRREVLTFGLDSAAEQTIYELPPVDGPVCLVLGAEGRGLSRLVRERCDIVAQIPLHGQLASLNVSAAAALACFEIARRRGLAAPS